MLRGSSKNRLPSVKALKNIILGQKLLFWASPLEQNVEWRLKAEIASQSHISSEKMTNPENKKKDP